MAEDVAIRGSVGNFYWTHIDHPGDNENGTFTGMFNHANLLPGDFSASLAARSTTGWGIGSVGVWSSPEPAGRVPVNTTAMAK